MSVLALVRNPLPARHRRNGNCVQGPRATYGSGRHLCAAHAGHEQPWGACVLCQPCGRCRATRAFELLASHREREGVEE
jgi:hypothetical protein